MNDFLIQTDPGEHHRLTVSRNENHPLIYISTNHRTIGLSVTMAEELLKALMAVLHGGFHRAISETSLRLEQEDLARRADRATRASERAPQSTPTLPTLIPQLGDL